MKRLKVFIHTLTITKKGERQFFQIPLPKNAVSISSIEFGCRASTLPPNP